MTTSSPYDLTVVIPTYNRAQLAKRAIESVIAQSHQPKEIIVIDDGSQDETPDVLAAFDDRITGIRQDNAGSSAARNHGVLAAASPWIAFLDSDDIWQPDHLDKMAQALQSTEGRGHVYFADVLTQFPSTMSKSGAGARLFELGEVNMTGMFELRDDGADWALRTFQPMLLQASVVRRQHYLDLGGLRDELRLRHDVHFFLRATIGWPTVAVNNVGTVMTADDDAERLTVIHDESSRQYAWESATLYRDALEHVGPLTPSHEKVIRTRLAKAHLQLARIALTDRRYLTMVTELGRSGRASPRTLATRITGRNH